MIKTGWTEKGSKKGKARFYFRERKNRWAK